MDYDRINHSESKFFLESIFPQIRGLIEVRAIRISESPDSRGVPDRKIKRFFFKSVDQIDWDQLKDLNNQGLNIYFGVCTRKEENGTKSAVLEVPGIWVDVDGKDFESKDGTWAHIERTIDITELSPTLIVDSGHGFHLYFLFKKPEVVESLEDIARLEGYVKGVSQIFGGDNTHDLSRLLRIPGFDNMKDSSDPKPCTVIRFENGRRYRLSDFDAYWVDAGKSQSDIDFRVEDISAEIPQRFFELLKKNTKLSETWEGKREDLNDVSGSGMDMALADALIKNGFTYGEIAKILTEAPYPKENHRTEEYLKHTISKAKLLMDERSAEKEEDDLPTNIERMIKEGKPKTQILGEIAKLEFATEREDWLRKLKDSTGNTLEALKEDLLQIMNYREKKAQDSQNSLKEYTEEEIAEAEELAKNPDLLDLVIKHTERAGHVGERINKVVIYLAFISRLLLEGISLVIKAASAAGKNALVEAVSALLPDSVYHNYTNVTAKALYYMKDRNLSHKILIIFEAHGSEAADYSIRSSLSEGKLKMLVTIKNPITGIFESEEIEIPAEGLVFIETTTQSSLYPENQTRLFDLYIDETEEQTRNIFRSRVKIKDTDSIEKDRRVFQALQTLLKSYQVFIPFGGILAETFPARKLRGRRDFPRFLALIEASALLHQYQREKTTIYGNEYLVATIEDYRITHEIAKTVLSQTLKEVTPTEEKVLLTVKEDFAWGEFSIGELRRSEKLMSIPDSTLRNAVKGLSVKGYFE